MRTSGLTRSGAEKVWEEETEGEGRIDWADDAYSQGGAASRVTKYGGSGRASGVGGALIDRTFVHSVLQDGDE